MKLRIQGDAIRLRLTRSEVEEITAGGSVENTLHFGSGTALAYGLRVTADCEVSAEFADARLLVRLPRGLVDVWRRDEEVSIEAEQAIGAEKPLKILIEKDFACLSPRDDEDQTDLFPNPEASSAR
jgi:hypothetical protein